MDAFGSFIYDVILIVGFDKIFCKTSKLHSIKTKTFSYLLFQIVPTLGLSDKPSFMLLSCGLL